MRRVREVERLARGQRTHDGAGVSLTRNLGGQELPFRLIRLGAPKTAEVSTTPEVKYKITFLLPGDSVGKSVQLQFKAGESSVDDSKEIIDG